MGNLTRGQAAVVPGIAGYSSTWLAPSLTRVHSVVAEGLTTQVSRFARVRLSLDGAYQLREMDAGIKQNPNRTSYGPPSASDQTLMLCRHRAILGR